jgi:glycosyltransferase involved in cell wall biosynthesis
MSLYKDDKVSIILPTLNSENFIYKCLDSIHKQTYKNFELIIIDGESFDKTISIIDSFKNKFEIKIYIKKTKNLAEALNFAISKSSGNYIARMDSDDIMNKNRIARQINFLRENHNYDVVGTNAFRKYEDSILLKPFNIQYRDFDLKLLMFFECPFIHPTILFRKDILKKNNVKYDENYNECEDFKLWFDIRKITSFRNLKYFGIIYRVHNLSASNKKIEKVTKYSNKIISLVHEEAKIFLTIKQQNIFNKIRLLNIIKQDDFDLLNSNYIVILNKFYLTFKSQKFDKNQLLSFLKNKYFRFCLRSINSNNFKPYKCKKSIFKMNILKYIFIHFLFIFKIKI